MSTSQRQVKKRSTRCNQKTALRTSGSVDNIVNKERLRNWENWASLSSTWGRNSSRVFKSIKVTFKEEKTILISLSMVKITENSTSLAAEGLQFRQLEELPRSKALG